MSPLCCYVFRRGRNAGMRCEDRATSGQDFCGRHKGKVMPVSHLPTLAISMIFEQMVQFCRLDRECLCDAYRRLRALAASCRQLREVIVSGKYYERLQSRIMESSAFSNFRAWRASCSDDMSAQSALQLVLESGCQRCGRPRIHKVYYPLPVRVCRDCFEDITVSHKHLRRFGVASQERRNLCASGIRCIKVESWSSWSGRYVERIYLKADVEGFIGRSIPLFERQREKYRLVKMRREQICQVLGVSTACLMQHVNVVNYDNINDEAVAKAYYLSRSRALVKRVASCIMQNTSYDVLRRYIIQQLVSSCGASTHDAFERLKNDITNGVFRARINEALAAAGLESTGPVGPLERRVI